MYAWTLAVAAALAMAMAPMAAHAATLNVIAEPSANASEVTIIDSVNIVITYPQNSYTSLQLRGMNYSTYVSAQGIPPDSDAFQALQQALEAQDPGIRLLNMSATVERSLYSNSTALVIQKDVVITAWVSGMFNRTSGGYVADLGWRDIHVGDAMRAQFGEEHEDLNAIGEDALGFGPLSHGDVLEGMMGDQLLEIASVPTINFSALNAPLSQWNRTYDRATNTTAFSMTVPTETLFFAQYTANGETYTMNATSDPSATIVFPGYAVASDNTVTITKAPPNTAAYYAAYAVAGAAIAAAAIAIAIRARRK